MKEHHPEVKRIAGRPKLPQPRTKVELNEMNARRQQTWRQSEAQLEKRNKAKIERANKREHIKAKPRPARKKT